MQNSENNSSESYRRALRRRRGQRQRTMIIFGILFFFSGLAGLALGILTPTRNVSDLLTPSLMPQPAKGELNLVLLGLDDADETHRTDTILWVNINTLNKSITLMSIPRDTLVPIPGHDYDKINAAYTYGGTQLALQTIANFIGLKPDRYAILSYQGFEKIVDAIGGVDINVEKSMYYVDHYANFTIDLKPGMQHLDGLQSLEYVRFRYDALGDIGRMRRQQEFLLAIKNKMLSNPSMIAKMPDILKVVLSNVQSDMSFNDALSWSLAAKDISTQPGFQIKRVFLDEGMTPKTAYGIDYLWPTQKVADIIKANFPGAIPNIPSYFPFPEDNFYGNNSVNTLLKPAPATTTPSNEKGTVKTQEKENAPSTTKTNHESTKASPSKKDESITLPQR